MFRLLARRPTTSRRVLCGWSSPGGARGNGWLLDRDSLQPLGWLHLEHRPEAATQTLRRIGAAIDELILKINPVTARAGITGRTSRAADSPGPNTSPSTAGPPSSPTPPTRSRVAEITTSAASRRRHCSDAGRRSLPSPACCVELARVPRLLRRPRRPRPDHVPRWTRWSDPSTSCGRPIQLTRPAS
jgi:hypothetical protein